MSANAESRYPLRSVLLTEAERIITQDRNKTYGEPDEDFQRIAAIASAMGFRVLKNVSRPDGDTSEFVPLVGSDVARFMIALKLSRLAWMPTHEDSWKDTAGYAACGYETACLEERRANPVGEDASLESEQIEFLHQKRSVLQSLAAPPPATLPLPMEPGIRQMALKAIAGQPDSLEAAGYFLKIVGANENCGIGCDQTHLFIGWCKFRVAERRHDA